MKFYHNIYIILNRTSLLVFVLVMFFFCENSAYAQTVQRNLQFGSFVNYGAGHITVSSDANSFVTTDGQVIAQSGGVAQSAILIINFPWKSPFNSVSISYSTNNKLSYGSNSMTLVPAPTQSFNSQSHGNQAYDLYVYIGGTLTLGSVMMPAGTYNGNFSVYYTFNY